MQEIAAAAGVSATTVSHALSGKRPVSAETQARIMQVIEERGYVPDAGGRRLKTGRSAVIGLAVPDISHLYFGSLAKGVEEAANEFDYGLIICSTSNADARREQRYFDMLRRRLVDGLVYTASRDSEPTPELARVAGMSPIVLADEAMPTSGLPSVTSANEEGGRLAGRHLRELGHRHVALLTGFPGLQSQRERSRGFREEFPGAVELHGDFELASGYALTAALRAQAQAVTAIFACNDVMAVGALQRLRDEGVRVPEDVSVVGFDDIALSGLLQPGLTTVRQDAPEIGRRAARMLLEALENALPLPTSSVTIPVELVVRGSTARVGSPAIST